MCSNSILQPENGHAWLKEMIIWEVAGIVVHSQGLIAGIKEYWAEDLVCCSMKFTIRRIRTLFHR